MLCYVMLGYVMLCLSEHGYMLPQDHEAVCQESQNLKHANFHKEITRQ